MRDQHTRTADRARTIAAEIAAALATRRQSEDAVLRLVAELVTLATATAPSAAVQPRLLTTEQAATALGVSPETVKRLIKSGELASRLIGTARRIPVESVDAYLSTLPTDLPNRPRAS